MKKNQTLFIIALTLLVIVGGVSFGYYVMEVTYNNTDAPSIDATTAELLELKYDAGQAALTSEDVFIPGTTVSKTFTVTITPGSEDKTANYGIYLNLTENGFVKCTKSGSGVESPTWKAGENECEENAQELKYTLKSRVQGTEGEYQQVTTGDLTGQSIEKVLLAKETKTVDKETTYEYQLEVTFVETDRDQNHNQNKSITGNVIVEFVDAEE